MTSNLPALSPRARKALEVLADGGRFVHRLERNSYTHRDQFKYHLLGARGGTIAGVGMKTFFELKDAGLLRICEAGNTSVSTYYRLNSEG